MNDQTYFLANAATVCNNTTRPMSSGGKYHAIKGKEITPIGALPKGPMA